MHCYQIRTILFAIYHFFHALLFNTNYSIQHYSFVCTQLNGSKYFYASLTIQLNICHLFTQLNNQSVLFLTIQFNIIHLFALRCHHSGSEWIWVWWQRRGNCIPLNFSITGASLSDYSMWYPGHSLCVMWGVRSLCRDAIGIFYSSSHLDSVVNKS